MNCKFVIITVNSTVLQIPFLSQSQKNCDLKNVFGINRCSLVKPQLEVMKFAFHQSIIATKKAELVHSHSERAFKLEHKTRAKKKRK